MLLEDMTDMDREKAALPAADLALRVKHVGEYGAHAAAKQAGFLKGDVIVAVAGRTDRFTEGALMAWLVNEKRVGDEVPVTVLRGKDRVDLLLPIQ